MGEVRSRVYRGGVLETEDFPVADVSEYLEQPDTMVWVDFCGPTEDQLDELARRARVARARRRGRARSPSAPEARPLRDPPLPVLSRGDCRRRSRRTRRVRDRRVHQRPLDHHGAQGRGLLDGAGAAALGPFARSRQGLGVSFLLYGLLDVVVDGYFDAVQSFDDFYDRVSEGIFSERPLDAAQQRHWFEMRPRAGAIPPSRRTDARSDQRAHAA